MSKISELGPITGANTRSEDLFVIVNLIQGDDGTKNITRKELVQAIQYEIFNRITITGGTIRNVAMSDSTLSNVDIDGSRYVGGTITGTDISASDFTDGTISDSTANNLVITNSEFNDGTGNNVILTNSTIDDSTISDSSANNVDITNSDFSDGTGNNNIFTYSTIDDSKYNRVTIDQGTANGLILTNITIDELILEDALISNSEIITSTFSNGDIFDVDVSNTRIVDTDISNSDIRDTDLDNVVITRSIFANGDVYDTNIANSTVDNSAITNSTANNIAITNSSFNDGTANNAEITESDFSDGTGNNNVFTNTTVSGRLEDSVIANSAFQGTMADVVATNMTISSSSSEELLQNKSTIDDSLIENSTIANTVIEESKLVDFDMDLTNQFEAPIDEDSYFALKNVQTGEVEQMTFRQVYDEFSRKTEKALKVHVASDGDDSYPGTILQPVRTLKRAEQLALEKAGGSYNRNDLNNAVHISVGPGTYYVDEPIMLPDDCSITSTAGQYATVIQKKKGWERTNGILVGSGCYMQGFSYMNFEVDNFDNPTGGFAIAYRPGALMRRSPYLRDSTQLSNFNRLDIEPPLNPFNSKGTIFDLGQEFYLEAGHSAESLFEVDDEVTFSSGAKGFISYTDDIDSNRQIYVRNLVGNVEVGDILYAQRGGTGTVEKIGIDDFPNRLVGRGGGNLLADRAVLDTDSLFTYVLCFGFTPRSQNGTGYVAKNGAGVNGIGSLSIFSRQAFVALDGGQMTLNNSGSQFGDISMRSTGKTEIVKPAEASPRAGETDTKITANNDFADLLEENRQEIIDDMINYLTSNTTHAVSSLDSNAVGLGYQGYNADKCFRDTGIIVENTGLDVATNSNYWGRLNGITYRSPISYVVVNEQLTETVGSIEHLKDSMEHIFRNANTEVNDRVSQSIDETLNVLQNGEEYANNIIFADTSNGPATGARETLQDNREFVIEEFIDWLDNNEEFFAYDSAKCKRDVREYILPAVKYDAMLDTNYNSVTAGYAYYFNAAKNVIGGQREETISAYERLRKSTDELIQANSAPMAADAYDKFNEIIGILKNDGDKFTPTAATYDTASGDFVITIGTHTLEVGRYILLEPEGFTFTCATDGNNLEFKHPRATDPAFKSALPITSTTATTITVNVGSTGYTGAHTLIEVKDNAVAVLGSEITFSDDTAISADKRNARKQLQANRKFIQDYMMGWADDEWFFYDSAKCQRDMKQYIVPAVLRDMQTGTNFNSIQSGIAYRSGIAKVAVNEQLTETIGAIEHLRDETSSTVSDPVVIERIEDAYNEIINIAKNESKKYTPTAATYDVNTGVMVVTIGAHDFQVGDTIIIEKESMTFECGSPAEQISHPRETDPAYNTPLLIAAKTATTITVNVGNAGGYTGAHTFVSANDDAIREAGVYDGKFTPTDVDYNPINGDMEITIGQHNLPVGKFIMIADESIRLSCANTDTSDVGEISHPRDGEPAFRKPVRIMSTSNTSITVNVGNAGGYTEDHTFVSAEVDCIDTNAIYWTDPAKVDSFFTPTDVDYNPSTGAMVITVGQDHGITTDDHIEFKPQSIVLSCVNTDTSDTVEIAHPRIGEPNYEFPLEVTAVSANTITVNPGSAGGYTGTHTFVEADAGSVIKLAPNVTRDGALARQQLQANKKFLQDEVDAWLADNYFIYNDAKCQRDTGFILDAVRRDMATGSNVNSVFAGLAYRTGNASAQKVIDDQLTETVGAITWLKGEIQGITSGTGETRANAAFNEIIDIMNNGAGNADARTFGTSYISEDALTAREILQANKEFLKDEVTAWIANTHPDLSYNVADCERDLGYFIDAVSWDVQHGSNAATINNSRVYFDMAVSVLAEQEKPVTAEAYSYIAEIAGGLVRQEVVRTQQNATTQSFQDGLTPSNGTYNPETGVTTLTITGHGLEAGDYIVIDEESITWECGTPATQISHPRATDPYFNTPIKITEVTTNTITFYAGTAQGYTEAHTFISADANAVKPSVAPSVANEVEKLFRTISDIIEEDSYEETFLNAGYGVGNANPEIKEPTLTGTGYDDAINTMAEEIAGSTPKYQYEIIEYIKETYNGLAYNIEKCPRDVGYIVDAVSEDLEYGGEEATVNAARYYFEGAVNILPYDQREPTRLVFEHLADVIEDIVTETAVTATTGNDIDQDTSGSPASAATGTEAKRLTNIISAVVDDRPVIEGLGGSLDISKGQQTPRDLPTANTDLTPAIEPSRTYARKALQMNKSFIQDEVVGYINNTYFTYDEDKCARDVGYIIDAVARDVETNSDYSSKYAGRAYRAGNASTDVVIDEQLTETIEAIKYVRDDIEPRLSGTALTAAQAAFANVISIMSDGVESLTYDFGTSRTNVSEGNAHDGLQNNKTFLQKEGRAYFEVTYPTLWAALSAEQRDKCERDIGYMVDAASWDVRHGSNLAMRDVARLYFDNGTSVLPADQKTETAAIFTHIASVAERIVLKLPVTKTSGNTETQSYAHGNVITQVGQDVQDLLEIVADIITADSLIAMPDAVNIQSSAVTASGYADAADVSNITARKSTLQNGVNAYLQEKFDYLEYDSDKCRRDTGYMVDAISHDIQYGGNAAMWNAAQIYFVNMTNLLPLEQREPTKKAFTHMAHVMHDIIRNEDIDLRVGRRFTPSTATYDPLDGEMVVTIGVHNLKVGDYIMFEKESITFECGSPAEEISHPREKDPAFNKPLKITAKTGTTITVNAGYAKGYAGTHTFVSATDNAVKVIIGQRFKQDKSTLAARREIAAEAKALALMVADIADDNNPVNLPARVEPYTDWMPSVLITEKDKVDDDLEVLVTSMINHISTEYNGISYPKEKCRRDVGIMVDAISHDTQYETNYATRLAANMYFDNATSVLPFDQRTQTADFYEEMANLVSKVILETAIDATEYTTTLQDTSGTPATATEGEYAADMIRIIEEAIRRDGLDAVPELVEPNTSWVEDSKVSAGKMIDGQLNELADDVVQHIKDNFTIIDYSKAKCRRDSGYIIDAMSWDLNYGGNLASRWNADFYYWNNELRIPENTRVATAQAYRQLGKIVSDVVVGNYRDQKLRPEMGSEVQQKQALELGNIFYNALYFNGPEYLGQVKEPDFTWEDDKSKMFRFSRDILIDNKTALQKEVQRFITSEYKFIDLPKTYRDSNNLLTTLQNDFRFIDASQDPDILGSDKSTRGFAAALFNIDAQAVFPVFNPIIDEDDIVDGSWRDLRFKGTVASGSARDDLDLSEIKRFDAYIIPTNNAENRYDGAIWYYDPKRGDNPVTGNKWYQYGGASSAGNNVDLLEAFERSWHRMKVYINTNVAEQQDQRDMVTELIENVLTDTMFRPNFLAFGSLVESIAHQFNGASAGVNRNALPLNFRNIGAAIGATASVLNEGGGRIRWSGSDELNNQYFARGLRINGRTGRIEGRPFTSSVRKLARRASNSRATI